MLSILNPSLTQGSKVPIECGSVHTPVIKKCAMGISRKSKVLPVLSKRSPPFPRTPHPFTGLNFHHKILTSFCPPILSALITHLPHLLPKFSSGIETLQVRLWAFLITEELTGWGGEMCIFSCGEEKRDQKRTCSFLRSSCP